MKNVKPSSKEQTTTIASRSRLLQPRTEVLARSKNTQAQLTPNSAVSQTLTKPFTPRTPRLKLKTDPNKSNLNKENKPKKTELKRTPFKSRGTTADMQNVENIEKAERGPQGDVPKHSKVGKGQAMLLQLSEDKCILEKQVSELIKTTENKTTEIATLKIEINRLKEQLCSATAKIGEKLQSPQKENQCLLDPVETVAASENEKEMLPSCSELCLTDVKKDEVQIFDLVEGAPRATPDLEVDGSLLLAERTLTEWDKASSSSISEMSVACLQDRIMQMEETHYSTNEELQATLQELTDLQDQLTDLQHENDRINDEKAVLLESLCSQTEKLEECRSQFTQLKDLFLNKLDEESSGGGDIGERERQLVQLLQSSREEKEKLERKLDELNGTLEYVQRDHQTQISQHQERVQFLGSSLESVNADKKLLEKQYAEAQEQVSASQIKISQLKMQLNSQQQKTSELQRERDGSATTEFDKLLREARLEKEKIETKVMKQQEQLAASQREVERLKEQISSLQEENMVTKNNAKKQVSDVEYRLEQVEATKRTLEQDLRLIEDALHQNEAKYHNLIEDKRKLQKLVSELQSSSSTLNCKVNELHKELDSVNHKHELETEEWKKFQSDLLVTVRVANDFKTEAQQETQQVLAEHTALQEKFEALERQIDEFKKQAAEQTKQRNTPSISTASSVLTSLENTARRSTKWSSEHRGANQSSVRNLIESIENASKQAKATNDLAGATPDPGLLLSNVQDIFIKSPLRATASDTTSSIRQAECSRIKRSAEIKSCRSDTEKDHPKPVSILASKLEPARRNSYGDVDKKDPLMNLVKGGGSKRNALLKWCQNKTVTYKGIDITNFSSSWNDGLAFCALLHSYIPDKIPYSTLDTKDKKHNFMLAFKAAESVGIPTTLNLNEMICQERPDWQLIMTYVTSIYRHFES